MSDLALAYSFCPTIWWVLVTREFGFARLMQASGRLCRTYLIEFDKRPEYLSYKVYWGNDHPIRELSSAPYRLSCPPILLGFPPAYSQTQIVKHLHSKPTPHHSRAPRSHELIAPLMMSTFPVPPPSCP